MNRPFNAGVYEMSETGLALWCNFVRYVKLDNVRVCSISGFDDIHDSLFHNTLLLQNLYQFLNVFNVCRKYSSSNALLFLRLSDNNMNNRASKCV